ncbi:hypothetical protein [Haloarcula laminariae]|uniref:hypothetical protein n=1 Tax=Haloarcula laminariae TaxID=2961577 RepID=UPI0024052131|nr:hypothetical protein [Halomicroarcula sp. FL173]
MNLHYIILCALSLSLKTAGRGGYGYTHLYNSRQYLARSAGKATLWRISLPFEAERRSSGALTPSPGGDLGPLLERQPELAPLIRLVLELLAGDLREIPLIGVIRFGPESTADGAGLVDGTTALSLGVDPMPETAQASLAVGD